MHCVNGKPRSSLLIESTDSMIRSRNGYFLLLAARTETALLWRCYTLILLDISRRPRWWCLKCVIVYLARDIRPFVIYCVNGKPRSSLLIESTDSMILLLLIIVLQWTYRDSVLSSDARLHVNPIHFLARRALCNGFSVTRPSLNQSFTIRHAVSLPLRRHSRSQSQLVTSLVPRPRLLQRRRWDLGTRLAGNISLTSFGIPRTWKSRDSRARAVTHVRCS